MRRWAKDELIGLPKDKTAVNSPQRWQAQKQTGERIESLLADARAESRRSSAQPQFRQTAQPRRVVRLS